jgi:mRNA interferase MazF
MTLRRGALVTVAAKGSYTARPRPALVIQATETLPHRDSVTLCLLTTDLIEAPLFRVRIEPAAANGLHQVSDVMADKGFDRAPFGGFSEALRTADQRRPRARRHRAAFLARAVERHLL